MSRERMGTIYSEMTNKGRCSTKYMRGAKPICCFRWVAEIKVNGKRYRKRSASRNDVEFWLENMRNRFANEPILEGAAAPAYSRDYHKLSS
jgi:hypothetical protein